jgi:hypothetical protein
MKIPVHCLFEAEQECNAVHKHQLDDLARSLKKHALQLSAISEGGNIEEE